MSHPQQMFFIANCARNLAAYFHEKKVLEVGSLNINGSVRDFFEDCNYLGLDVAEGRDVDLVCKGEDYGAPASSFDVVISSEMFEHNKNYVKCWLNMIRMMREDGLLIFTCATMGRRQHGTTKYQPQASPLTVAADDEYYKNLTEIDFTSVVGMDAFFSVWSFFEDRTSHDIYFMGVGSRASQERQVEAQALINGFREYFYKKNVLGEY
ncbi:methyltransferase domain-containing protein [Diaphorobacter sp. LR2014-1]|uniref:methyltransferase domain-containing protein n=1 Tax=Diaphorobacter sp. LR2014-1 TaxID=1933219 RepID=UPI0011AF1014|nr:methyltransferase domain-containing protein [Diaphorobacter sp. LR2014-1]